LSGGVDLLLAFTKPGIEATYIYITAFMDIAQIPDNCPVEVTGTGGRSPVNVR
jgi:hypothetical protein